MFLSNFLSNTATAALLIPLGSVILPDKPVLPTLVIALAASTSLFLPISTPTNAVVYATGLLAQRDFRQVGTLVGLIGPPMIVALCLLLDVQ
jgi:sodium-dependent dicarboxylate transporter 2/3/5